MSDFRQRLSEWLKGDLAAVDFVDALFDVAHFWDDLIDGDREISAAYVNASMWKALVTLQENQFFAEHKVALMPVIKLAIVNWHTANGLEQTEEPNDKQVAFVLRSTYADILAVCAFLVGGRDWALFVSAEARREASAEGFPAYLDALLHEKRKL
jgi:hypothetical protein